MTLGFTVADLLPHGRGSARLAMGLVRLSEADWLFPAPDLQARAVAFDAHPEAIRLLPGAETAAREAAALLHGPGDLAHAARSIWEDICLLQPVGSDGAYVLTAGAVAFPTDWRLEDKMGLPLTAIHAPIHGYAEQLASGVDHFMRSLPAGPIYGRANWFITASAAWRYMPQDDPANRFAHVRADNAGQALFVRCERQTLRRLPDSGAILFTIGIAVEPLGQLPDVLVRRIAAALAVQPEEERDRRAAPGYAAALQAFAAPNGHAL